MQSYKKRVDATCPGRSVIITNDKRIFKNQDGLDDKDTRAKQYRTKYMGIDKNNVNRLDVSIYPRIIQKISPDRQHTCKALTLKDAMTVAVTDHVMERMITPVTIDTELAELRNCPLLWRIGFDIDRIKEVCQRRNVKLKCPHWDGKTRQYKRILKRIENGRHKYKGCDDNLRRSSRVASKPVEFSAHEFAAPIIPVKKDESQNEEDDNDTIIIDNDIPFSEIASSLQNKSTSIKPSLQLAIENCKEITCITSDSESGELVSETEIRNRTQNWINNQDPELLPKRARRRKSRSRRALILSDDEKQTELSLDSSNMVAPLSDEDFDFVPEIYHPVIDGNLTNSDAKDLPYEASTPKRSKRILATRSSGRMPKIHGMNWENERFKIKINDRRAAFNCCFSGYEQGGPNSEIKNKASGWLMSIYWARRSCDDIIKSLEGTIHC
ncbi:unnamed protein product [Oikopleura dioica]|uniref:Uncharacterized protein n=1 Tax=Oikopleura dioica TaxID=34765 RepID=E4XAM5_OIKDI|nr:unnamed protein product [Oikopleura dioica]